MVESIDSLILIKDFNVLQPLMAMTNMKHSLRLLSLFGFNGEEVIFATTEDRVFCYGQNRYGSLGLGVANNIQKPTLNEILSGKGVINIYDAFGEGVGCVIALTANGLCYGWGGNDTGQLGNGTSIDCYTPTLVAGMADKFVVQIGCGKRHVIALTIEGQVYGWGCNWFGQTGGNHAVYTTPIKVDTKETMKSISSGKCHCLGLSDSGRVYLWGLNETGQLGRHRDQDKKVNVKRASCPVPQLVAGFEDTVIKKALCGPNHTIFLTTDGQLYTFGFNECGQIGNGNYETQWTPFKVGDGLVFKDFVVNYDNDLTIGVTVEGTYFVWGFNYYMTRISTPYEITDYKSNYSLFDLYAHFTAIPKLYESLVFEANKEWLKRYRSVKPRSTGALNGVNNCEMKGSGDYSSVHSTTTDTNESLASNPQIIPGVLFLKRLSEAFNNPHNYDLKFVISGEEICCHKTVLKIRNKKFWHKCEQHLDRESQSLIQMKSYSFQAVYCFIEWLYGKTPEISDSISKELSKLADNYDEPELKCLCPPVKEIAIDLTNVCPLYEMSINDNNTEVKNSCIEFAKNNWKVIFKSQEFEEMDDKIAKQFMKLIMN